MLDISQSDSADTPKEPLDPGVKILLGVIFPHCILASLVFLLSYAGRPGAAGGFAALGLVMAGLVVGAISFFVDLCLIGFIEFVERRTAFLVGCIIPFFALFLILLAGG